ncbi:Pikachurin-like protein, partial [Leptotrombidium deliense]
MQSIIDQNCSFVSCILLSIFDCGMGEGVIRSDRPVVLKLWNTLTIYRDGWAAWMQLNSQRKVSGQAQGLFSRITFKLELFLGGSPNL